MKSIPIIMSGDMAVKSHTGEKGETRRPCIDQSPDRYVYLENFPTFPQTDETGYTGWAKDIKAVNLFLVPTKCPYGTPGDELWVKETCYLHGVWVVHGLYPKTKTGRVKRYFMPHRDAGVKFPDNPPLTTCTRRDDVGWFKRNPRFMPRWACRTTLIVRSIRAERLKEITHPGARAEGFDSRADFMEYWDSLYAKKPELQSDANPWVWVVGW